VSGNPCERAHSRTLTTLCCSGCKTRPWRKWRYSGFSQINLQFTQPYSS